MSIYSAGNPRLRLRTFVTFFLTLAGLLVITVLLRFAFLVRAQSSANSRLGYAPSQPVGNLSGQFSVDGNGSAGYTIPLEVPPGTGGLAPSLELSYSSRGPNGYLGMGWSLNGISAITRCGANYRTDGYKAEVAFDARDRFCMDGRRLMVVSGQYGASDAVYHTEIETWTIIVSHGVCGAGPCFFTATTKDGHALSFGATTGAAGSRILAQGRNDGTVRTWSIDAYTDLNGNTSAVSYASDSTTGEYYPTRIDYTANSRTGLTAQRSVRFEYSPRADVVQRFLAGSQVRISKLLTGIHTHVIYEGADQTILKYKLAYEASPATGRSRLNAVTLCDGSDTCWPATRLDWYTSSEQFLPAKTKLPGPTYVIFNGQQYPFGILMDINGDGIADYSQAAEFVDGHTELNIYLGHPDGSYTLAPYKLPGPIWRVTSLGVVQVGLLKDINGDGILDYSHALRNDDAHTTDYTVYLGTGHGFSKDPNYQLPGPIFWQVNGQTLTTGVLEDMNGDGIPDYSRATVLLSTGEKLLDIYKGTGSGFTKTGTTLPGPLYAVDATGTREVGILRDINGDGIADYSPATLNADTGKSDLRVFLGRSPDFTFNYAYNLPGPMLWVVNGTVLESGALVDINGDGIPDYSRATLLESSGEKMLGVNLGTANGFTPHLFDLPGPLFSVRNNESFNQGLLTDWNGDETTRYSAATRFADGREDLAVYLGNGQGFRPTGRNLPKAMFLLTDRGTYSSAVYEDVNGDGITDFVDSVCTVDANGGFTNCTLGVQLAAGPFSDLLKTVTNGFGGSTAVEYGPLTSGIYEPGTITKYPIRSNSGPMTVVSKFTNHDGRGNSYSYGYRYKGAHTDALGFGWLGFEQVTMTDLASGRSSPVNYAQSFPYYGLVTASEERDRSGNLMAATALSYTDNASPPLQKAGVHEPLRSNESYTQYTNNSPDYTLKKEYQYDAYGNVALASDLGSAATHDEDVYTCFRYSNDPATGRFGYLLQSKTDRTKEGCVTFITAHEETIVWDPAVDLLWSKIAYDSRMNVSAKTDYDDSNHLFLTETFSNDDFGNVLTATSASGNKTTYTYDAVYHAFRTTSVSPQLTRNQGSYQLTTLTTFEPGFGMLVSTTDPNGNVNTERLDGFGRPVEVYGPNNNGQSTLIVTATWITKDGAFYLQSLQRPAWTNDDQPTWYWDKQFYDGLDRIYRSERNGLKNGQPAVIASDTAFDSEGRIRETTEPYYLGDPVPKTTIDYDDYNRPILTIDAAGVKRKIDYAQGGLKVTETEAYDTPVAQTEIRYMNGRGLVRETVDPNELRSTYEYDKLGQLLSVATAPEVRTTQMQYDSLNRLRRLERTDTGVATWTFDSQGYLRQSSDGAGNTVSYPVYDALDRLRQRSMTYSGGSSSTSLSYDDPDFANGMGNLTRVETTDADVGTFTYTYGYTAFGQVKSGAMNIAGSDYVYGSSYDPYGRVTSATYPDGSVLTVDFLADSNLSAMSLQETGESAPQRYATYASYTALGQAQEEHYERTGVVVRNTFYPVGNSFSLIKSKEATAPRAATKVLYSRAYSWNQLNSLVSATDLLHSPASETFTYNDQPVNAHMDFLTGAQGSYGKQKFDYDLIGNATKNAELGITYVQGKDWLLSTSAGTTFTYYNNGNLKTRTEDGVTWSYAYDSGGLLVGINRAEKGQPVQSGHSAYDASGRQVFYQRPGDTQKTYWITKHFELVDLGNGSFQHTLYVPGNVTPLAAITKTGRGNTPSAATRAALADLYGGRSLRAHVLASWNRALATLEQTGSLLLQCLLLGIIVGAASFGVLLYRAAARRRRTMLAPFCTAAARYHPLFAAITPLVAVCLLVSSSMPAHADITPGSNGPGIPTPGRVFFLPNQLESTVLVTNEAGAVTASLSYLPYGAIDQSHSSGTDNFRPKFAGSEWDPKSSLYHMGMRYYAPDVGRFLSPDPGGQFTSPYVYAGNNPVSMIDPNGSWAFLVAIIIGAVLGAYFGGVAVNHDMNPLSWNWRSGKTYAGLIIGAVIGSVGAAAGGVAVQAGVAVGASGGVAAEIAGVAIGIGGQVVVGAAENAAFTALGGGSSQEIIEAAGEGALWSGTFAVAGEAIGGLAAQFARRSRGVAESADSPAVLRREAGAVEEAVEDVCSASFVAGTPVVTVDGKSRPIDQIKTGDQVDGRDLELQQDSPYRIGLTTRHRTQDFVTLTFTSGHSVTTTPEHPFRGYKRGWIPAQDLEAGDQLDGAAGAVTIASVTRQHTKETATVYDFVVEGAHNFRVSEEGVLVHNPKQKKGKTRVCTASIDAYGVVTETWSESELQRRFPAKSDYQAVVRDIRAKARNANKIINSGKIKPMTRVAKPVKTASKEWVRYKWAKVNGNGSAPPTSIRTALRQLRNHFHDQDVDEYLTRIQGGLTIREGMPENQGPLNSFVNQTSGAAMGALSRSGKAVPIARIVAAFVKAIKK